MSKLLSQHDFIHVIRCAPLVAIDLLLTDSAGRVLLGKRRNAPARNEWFVPGGRIRKGETIDRAFLRITLQELGVAVSLDQARLLGVFTHLYPDNVFGVREEGGAEVSTHYVVLAYQLPLMWDLRMLPARQHDEYAWAENQGPQTQVQGSGPLHDHVVAYLLALGDQRVGGSLWPATSALARGTTMAHSADRVSGPSEREE